MIKLKQIIKEQDDTLITLYHLTTPKNYESIKKDKCLDPQKTNKLIKVLEFSKDKNSAKHIINARGWIFRPTPYYVLLTLEIPKVLITKENQFQAETDKTIDTKYITNVEKVEKPDISSDIFKKYKKNQFVVYILKNSKKYGVISHIKPYYIDVVDITKDFPFTTPELEQYEPKLKYNRKNRSELSEIELQQYEQFLISNGFKLSNNNKIETT